MKKILLMVAVAAIVGVAELGLASAHVGTKPALDCDTVSANFTSFPSGTHNVTFVVEVNGLTTNVPSSFTGRSGTASANISSLTSATGNLDVTAYAKWTDDGGGKTETQSAKLVCHTLVVAPPETPKLAPPVATPVIDTPVQQVNEGK